MSYTYKLLKSIWAKEISVNGNNFYQHLFLFVSVFVFASQLYFFLDCHLAAPPIAILRNKLLDNTLASTDNLFFIVRIITT